MGRVSGAQIIHIGRQKARRQVICLLVISDKVCHGMPVVQSLGFKSHPNLGRLVCCLV